MKFPQPYLPHSQLLIIATASTDWIIALTSILGAFATTSTLVFLAYQWVQDRRRENAREEIRQASKVSCWFIQTGSSIGNDPSGPTQREVSGKLYWVNSSESPVYGLYIQAVYAPLIVGETRVGTTIILSSTPYHLLSLAPRDEGNVDFTWKFTATDTAEFLLTGFMLGWVFIDSAGRKWVKDSRGKCQRTEGHPEMDRALWEHLGAEMRKLRPTASTNP